jgi:hypothetical protein
MDIGKIFNLVAFGARVAIDALVLATPVQVHVVFQAKVGIGLLDRVTDGLGRNFFYHGYVVSMVCGWRVKLDPLVFPTNKRLIHNDGW